MADRFSFVCYHPNAVRAGGEAVLTSALRIYSCPEADDHADGVRRAAQAWAEEQWCAGIRELLYEVFVLSPGTAPERIIVQLETPMFAAKKD